MAKQTLKQKAVSAGGNYLLTKVGGKQAQASPETAELTLRPPPLTPARHFHPFIETVHRESELVYAQGPAL